MSCERASPDLLLALGAFIEQPEAEHFAVANALRLSVPPTLAAWQVRYTEACIEQCQPNVSVYVSGAGTLGGEAADRVAGFRRAIGVKECVPSDALGLLMADYAALCALASNDSRARHARRVLLWEHLLAWMPPYLTAVRRSAPAPYRQWARLMGRVFRNEARAEGAPETLPLHLRLAPPFQGKDDFASVEALLGAVLSPARSGLVLTRRDLGRAARAVGAADGFGGRRFMLRTLLEQQPGAVLDWLAREAGRQVAAYGLMTPDMGSVGEFWQARACATAKALEAMSREARCLDGVSKSERQAVSQG